MRNSDWYRTQDLSQYSGQWVVIKNCAVISHGTLKEVLPKTDEETLLVKIPPKGPIIYNAQISVQT